MIPVNSPFISKESKELVTKALAEGWISSSGPYVEQFEQEFASFIGTKHAIFVNTGTAALHVSLLSLGIGVGDEVIVPAFTMAASWMAVMQAGATPVFVEVEADIYTLDPDLLATKLTSRTRAIMPVHIYGHPAEMAPILDFAHQHHLFVVEDAAEAHGATYQGIKVGSLGDINAFSFYANKIITTGEGGMVTTNNDNFAMAARSFRDLCHSPNKRFIHEKMGYNYRATNLQAALGLGSLHNVKTSLAQKAHMAELYTTHLQDIPGLTLPTTRDWATNVYWMYAILVDPEKFGMSKDILRQKLLTLGIDTRDFFYPPCDQPVLNTKQHFPVTESVAANGLYLPSGLALSDTEIKKVCSALRSLYQGHH